MAGIGASIKEQWRSLTGEQHIAVGVFGVMGLVIAVFSLIHIRSLLLQPFTTPVQTLVDVREALGPTSEELIREQQRSDTDGDGISDYDESTRYFTSPYVRDSDSDGDADNTEIARGTDPNCAKGTTCTSVAAGTSVATGTAPGFGGLPGVGEGSVPAGGPTGFVANPPPRDAAAIRAYLQESGVSAADLANYTDEQLLNAYDQSTNGQAGEGQDPTAP